jgi:tetratricopeptide (TPR) repeat protein
MGRKRTRAWKYIFLCTAGLIFLSSCAIFKESQISSEIRDLLRRGQNLQVLGAYEEALTTYEKVLSLTPQRPPGDEALFSMGLIYAHFNNPKKDYQKAIDCFVRIINDYPGSPLADQAKIWIGVLQQTEKLSQEVKSLKLTMEDLKQAGERLERTKPPEPKVEQRGEAYEALFRAQRLLAQGDFEGSLIENQKVLSSAGHKPPEDEALFNLGLIYAHSANPKRDYSKSLDFFRKLLKDYPKSPLVEQAKIWIAVLQENEKLNQVIEKSKQVDLEIEEKKREIAK